MQNSISNIAVQILLMLSDSQQQKNDSAYLSFIPLINCFSINICIFNRFIAILSTTSTKVGLSAVTNFVDTTLSF